MTIIQQPNKYNFSEANQLFVFQIDSTETIKYITVSIVSNNSIVSTLKIYKTPNKNLIYFDLKEIIKSLTSFQFYNFDSLLNIAPIFNYSLSIDYNSNLLTTDSFFVINGNTDLISDSKINIDNYILNSNKNYSNYFSFLNQINYKNTNIDSIENLSFINDGINNIIVRILFEYENANEEVYLVDNNSRYINTDSNKLIKIINVNNLNKSIDSIANGLINLNVSMSTLINYNLINIKNELKYYNVTILDSNLNQLSEIKYYSVNQICNKEFINIAFETKFGATETFQLYQPTTNLTTTKNLELGLNTFKINDNNQLTNLNNKIFNKESQLINISNQTILTAYSNKLNDDENKLLTSLIYSKNIYLEIDNKFIPVSLNTTTINSLKASLAGESNFKEFQFILPSTFLLDFI